jgi:DNA gyrase/topoisomerase IV subunit B
MLLNFLYHWKELFEQKRVYIIPSPRYVLTKGKGAKRQVVYFYDTETYEAEHSKYKGYETRYIKGLATLRDYEYAEVLNNESKWIQVKIDDPECFKIMYSDNVEARKELMS